MTEPTLAEMLFPKSKPRKNRGGRPPNPAPPVDAAETRRLISIETVKTTPNEKRLRQLYRLLKAYERGQEAAREDARVIALEQTASAQAEIAELRRSEWKRRYFEGALGLRENERLKARVQQLETELATLRATVVVESGRRLNA